tara:strand:- start:107 stop:622 length:516 start_codon:yes stop_codon:yes gene_type:complete
MRAFLYLFFFSIFFYSCQKEQGCMDVDAVNFSENAEEDDGGCMYSISGVWETQTVILNDENISFGTDLTYIWDNGEMATQTYDVTGNLIGYSNGTASLTAGDPNILEWFGNVYEYSAETGNYLEYYDIYVVVFVDKMTDAYNMTFRYEDFPSLGDIYVKTLIKSAVYNLSD